MSEPRRSSTATFSDEYGYDRDSPGGATSHRGQLGRRAVRLPVAHARDALQGQRQRPRRGQRLVPERAMHLGASTLESVFVCLDLLRGEARPPRPEPRDEGDGEDAATRATTETLCFDATTARRHGPAHATVLHASPSRLRPPARPLRRLRRQRDPRRPGWLRRGGDDVDRDRDQHRDEHHRGSGRRPHQSRHDRHQQRRHHRPA